MSDLKLHKSDGTKATGKNNTYGLNENKDEWKVKSGDNLWKIASEIKKILINGKHPYQSFNVPQIISAIKTANGLDEQKYIHPNQVLKIPKMEEPGQSKSKKESLEDIFEKVQFSPLAGSVVISEGKTLAHALYEFISIKNNPVNKSKWESILNNTESANQKSLATLQKLYVRYKLNQWVKMGVNVNNVPVGSSLITDSSGKFQLLRADKTIIFSESDGVSSPTTGTIRQEILPLAIDEGILTKNKTSPVEIKQIIPAKKTANEKTINKVWKIVVQLINEGKFREAVDKTYEEKSSFELLLSNIITCDDLTLSPDKKMQYLLTINKSKDGMSLIFSSNAVFFALLLKDDISFESKCLLVEYLGDPKHVLLQNNYLICLSDIKKHFNEDEKAGLLSILNSNSKSLWEKD